MSRQFTLQELAELTGADLAGDPSLIITGVDELASASSSDASFLANRKYLDALRKTEAGVVCIDRETQIREGLNALVSDSPSKTFQMIANAFLNKSAGESGFHGIHPSAIVHSSVTLGTNVTIGPYSIIDQGSIIGDHVTIHAHVTIGSSVTIGEKSVLHPQVVVRELCTIGKRVIIQPGAVIGSCGFGYLTDQSGSYAKIPQLGNVVLEDDVEIGANTTIDRARFKSTKISRGSKIDNLVQIAHNVVLGERNIIVSQTGIAGSVQTGDEVVMGGQVGIAGHLKIATGAKITAQSGVSKSLTEPKIYRGSPAIEMTKYNRREAFLRKIETYAARIDSLEKQSVKNSSIPVE